MSRCLNCGVRNPYSSSQDGSRELWQHEHDVHHHSISNEFSDVDLPQGYRWAEGDEIYRADGILVTRTFDSRGNEYAHGEADIAVPL